MKYLVVDPRYVDIRLDANILFSSEDKLEAAKVAIEFGNDFCVVAYDPESKYENLIYQVGQEEFLFTEVRL